MFPFLPSISQMCQQDRETLSKAGECHIQQISQKKSCSKPTVASESPRWKPLSVTMVYPPPGRLIYQGNSPTLSPG